MRERRFEREGRRVEGGEERVGGGGIREERKEERKEGRKVTAHPPASPVGRENPLPVAPSLELILRMKEVVVLAAAAAAP